MATSNSTPNDGHGTQVSLAELIALRQEARRLDITPRGKVLATRSGGHLSRFRGRGMEFDESRVYQPGDEPRNMDWRVTARSGMPHVKLFREERERPVWLLVDQGRSMQFGTRVAFKSVIAARAAALLGWAAADKGDRVGGMTFDEDSSAHHRPAAGNRGLLPVLYALSSDARTEHRAGFAGLADAANQFAPMVSSGSLVFVLSDFRDLNDANAAWMGRLGRHSELVLVQVFDPLEMAPPPPGRYPVSDGEHRRLLDTSAAPLRSDWESHFHERNKRLEHLCLQHQAHLIGLRTDQPVGETLQRELGPQRFVSGVVR
jgi:uncharacterized protein (DUF58 family)